MRADVAAPELVGTIRAMATDITVRVNVNLDGTDAAGEQEAQAAMEAALRVFADVEVACTRFDPESPLMRANASAGRWQRVDPLLFAALGEAHRAYETSSGRFDPRVLGDLVALGYDRTLPFAGGGVATSLAAEPAGRPGPWRPRFRSASGRVHLGGAGVDLGGIGKGLAVRWASEALRRYALDHLVEAGGDCYCGGVAPGGGPWMVGVEDPVGGGEPIAVLALSDRAVTTSSVRLRRWRAGATSVHHLIDPATGRPGGEGLQAVTVVSDDPATAETWSEVLCLAGRRGIASEARRAGLAALWVADDGSLETSSTMGRHVAWRRS